MSNLKERLQNIKDEVAQQYSYKDYQEFKDLTRRIDTDIVFVMDCMLDLVCKRYAEEVIKEASERSLLYCVTLGIEDCNVKTKQFYHKPSATEIKIDKQSILKLIEEL